MFQMWEKGAYQKRLPSTIGRKQSSSCTYGLKNLPRWTRPVKINNRLVLALLDTVCTKSMVHLRCVQESDHLPWKIPYKTASSRKTYFPTARVTLQIEGKDTELAVGVSPHISVDMLLGRDVPHFRKLLKETLVEESSMKPKINLPSKETKEETRIQTSLVTTRAQLDRQHLQDLGNKKSRKRMNLLYTQ